MQIFKESINMFEVKVEVAFPIEPYEADFIGNEEQFKPYRNPEVEFGDIQLDDYQYITEEFESTNDATITNIEFYDTTLDKDGCGTVTICITFCASHPFVFNQSDLDYIGDAFSDAICFDNLISISAIGCASGIEEYVDYSKDDYRGEREWVEDDYYDSAYARIPKGAIPKVKILETTSNKGAAITEAFKIGDRVKQTYANPYNVGTILDVINDEEGVRYKVHWDYSDGPDIEVLPVGEPLSPYSEEDEKNGYYESRSCYTHSSILRESSGYYSLEECVNEYLDSGSSGELVVFSDIDKKQLYHGDLEDVLDTLDCEDLMVIDDMMAVDVDPDDEVYDPNADIIIVVV